MSVINLNTGLNTGKQGNSGDYAAIGRQFVQFIENCLNEAPVEFGEGSGAVNLSEYRQQIIREVMNSTGEIAPKGAERVASFASYQGTHIYGCWCANRTTPIVVRAVNAAEARKLANSKKKSNAGDIIKVARLDEKDAQKARQGQWVRTRAGGDRPESYSEVAESAIAHGLMVVSFGRPIGGKKKSCNKGYSCGYGCISTKKACQNRLKGQANTYAEYISNIGTNKTDKQQAAPDATQKGVSFTGKPLPSPTANHDNTVIPKKISFFAGSQDGIYYHDVPIGTEAPGVVSKTGKLVERRAMNAEEHASYSKDVYGTDAPANGKKVVINEKEQIEDLAKKTGMSLSDAEESYLAIRGFSNTDYEDIRAIEAGKITDPDEILEYQPKIDAINRYLEQAPKYQGTISRGLTFDSAEERDEFLQTLQGSGRFEPMAMSSWTSSSKVSSGFAEGGFGVVLVADNYSGASVQNVSSYTAENEIIVPKGTRYALNGSYKTLPNGAIAIGLSDRGSVKND